MTFHINIECLSLLKGIPQGLYIVILVSHLLLIVFEFDLCLLQFTADCVECRLESLNYILIFI